MMRPEVEAALKTLLDLSGSAIRRRVLKTPEAAKVEIEVEGEGPDGAPEMESEVSPMGELSEEDAALIEEALEQMGGR